MTTKTLLPKNSDSGFEQIANEYINTHLDKSEKIDFAKKYCPDQIVGKVKCDSKKIEYLKGDSLPCYNLDSKKTYSDFTNRDDVDQSPNINNTPKIILILESPHIEEFTSCEQTGVGPAKGATGQKIRERLSFAAKSIDFSSLQLQPQNYSQAKDCIANLVLVNSIQFQCSLGLNLSGKTKTHDGKFKKNRKIRDEVFKECWKKDSIGADHFKKRLLALLNTNDNNNTIIINCCTKVLKQDVQEAIDKAVRESGLKINLFQGPHPSSWFRQKTKIRPYKP